MKREKDDDFPDCIKRAYITNSLKSGPLHFGVITMKHKVADVHPYSLLHIEKDKLHIILRMYPNPSLRSVGFNAVDLKQTFFTCVLLNEIN